MPSSSAFFTVASYFGYWEATLDLLNKFMIKFFPKLATGKRYYSSFPWINHPLCLRHATTDLQVIKYMFKYGDHTVTENLPNIKFIIDCGAHGGYSSLYYLTKFPNADVVAVESDRDNFRICEINLRPYKTRAKALHAGIWTHPTGLKVVRGQFGDGQDWSFQVRETKPGESADITATSIDDILKKENRTTIDLLKVNIERAELVLFGKPCPWLDGVKNIFIELHGKDCEDVFFKAMSAYTYELTKLPEYYFLGNISKKQVQ